MTTPLKSGVHCVMATPFLPDESLDEASLATLIDFLVASGCDGILILGVLGEADKLSDAERDRMVHKSIELSAGRLQVSVGITHNSTNVTRQRALASVKAGAASVMVSPPPGSASGPALKEHFVRIAADLPIPFVIQDHPTSSGVKMSVDFMASLFEHMPPNSVVKLEDPPTAPKMRKLLELAPHYQVLGGLGGVSLLHELDAGSHGTMTGFALPELLVSIVKAHRAGNRDKAQAIFNDALPLMVFEAQPGAGVALRKEILKRQCALAHATVRQPAPKPDAFMLELLDDLLAKAPLGVAK
jgi:4-hydroxy-tetrahydrodipicolinate synthase